MHTYRNIKTYIYFQDYPNSSNLSIDKFLKNIYYIDLPTYKEQIGNIGNMDCDKQYSYTQYIVLLIHIYKLSLSKHLTKGYYV